MPEEPKAPRPDGNKLNDALQNAGNERGDNQAHVQGDAQPDIVGGAREESDRDEGRGSTANGVPSSDEDDGALRKRQYKNGAELVSGID